MNNNGFSFVEMLMSLCLLVIVSMALTEFATNTLDFADSHTRQVERAMGTRLASERITELISQASYIFPANTDFILNSTQFESDSRNGEEELMTTVDVQDVNTSDAIALLVPARDVMDTKEYKLYVFYLANGTSGNRNLYEFSADTYKQWDANTLPASTFNDSDGTSTLLAKDIIQDLSQLSYILCPNNSSTDTSLLSAKSITNTSNPQALISGASWTLVVASAGKVSFSVKGVAKNVPRYLQPSQYGN